jgi:DNA helicase-2/ATP-dependent DNA helicase PcrA
VLTRTVARADELAAALGREGIPILRPRRARPDIADDERPKSPLAQALLGCPASPSQLDSAQRSALWQARDTEAENQRAEIGEPHESDEWDARLQRVAVLTLHGSKGLEFPVVFLCGCEAELLPGPAASPAELAEERRLFYVGMTRAKDQLWLSHAGPRPRSPFIDELPGELLHIRAPSGPRKPKPPQLKLF